MSEYNHLTRKEAQTKILASAILELEKVLELETEKFKVEQSKYYYELDNSHLIEIKSNIDQVYNIIRGL